MNRPLRTRMFDTMANFVSGLGILGVDKNVSTQYSFTPLDRNQLEAAYRGDWVARKCVDIPALDSTREWRQWQADKKDIAKIEELEQKFDLLRKVKRAMIRGRLYGGGALILGMGDDSSQPLDVERVGEGDLRYIHVVTCYELSAGELETDIESEWFGEPKEYMMTSRKGELVKLHPSRVVRFLGAELPNNDININPAGHGWGDPIIQVIDDAVKNVGLVSQGCAALVHEAKLDIIKIPDFHENVSTSEYRERLNARFAFAMQMKSMMGANVMDTNDEWDRKEVAFGSLPDVMKMYLLIASGAADIPATRLLGQSPAGLNSTGESDIRNYYDRISAEQRTELTPALRRLDEVLLRSALGDLPDMEEQWYEWAPLWQATEDEKASTALKKAQAFQIDVNAGMLADGALKIGRENQLIEDGTYPGFEQALIDAEALEQQALNELDPEVRAQYEEMLITKKAGLPMLPPPMAPGEEGNGPPGGGFPPKKKKHAAALDMNECHNPPGEGGGQFCSHAGKEIHHYTTEEGFKNIEAGQELRESEDATYGKGVYFIEGEGSTGTNTQTWGYKLTYVPAPDAKVAEVKGAGSAVDKWLKEHGASSDADMNDLAGVLRRNDYDAMRVERPSGLVYWIVANQKKFKRKKVQDAAALDMNPCHDPATGQFCSTGGEGEEAAAVANAIKAPAHARIDPGNIGYAKKQAHAEALSELKAAGFQKVSGSQKTEQSKLGRSQAYSSSKEKRAELTHPDGHSATIKTTEQKYGGYGPTSYIDITIRKKRAAQDAQPRPLYVRRDVVNKGDILKWAKEQGVEIEKPDELHVTILYSRAPVDWIKIGESHDAPNDNGDLEIKPGGPRVVERFEPSGTLALQFASSALCWRHEHMVRQGASHDWDDYLPHITLSGPGIDAARRSGAEVAAIEPYRGRIVLGPEIFEDIKE